MDVKQVNKIEANIFFLRYLMLIRLSSFVKRQLSSGDWETACVVKTSVKKLAGLIKIRNIGDR